MLERLVQLEKNIAQREAMKLEHSKTEFSASTHSQWALRYGLIESIQIVIDNKRLYDFLSELDVFRDYARSVSKYL